MSSSRQVDVLSYFPGGCEAIADDFGAASIFEDRYLSGRARHASASSQAVLVRAIVGEIIPRLMLAHRQASSRHASFGRNSCIFKVDQVEKFTNVVVRRDATVAQAFVEALLYGGATVEQIFTQLFAPAARRLGRLWELDRRTFVDVTIGLSRIQQLVQELGPLFERDMEPSPSPSSALLMNMPGEHHSLGIMLVEQFFRRAGWNVRTPQKLNCDHALTVVREERFDMVGISVTCQIELDRVASMVGAIRGASANRELLVMVGGLMFNEHPEYVTAVGADATDVDGSHATHRLKRLSPRLRAL